MKRLALALAGLLALASPPASAQQLQSINVGGSANDGTGDSLRTAFTKANANFSLLSTALAGKAGSIHTHVVGDVTGLQTALDGKQPFSTNLTALSAFTGSGTTASTFAAGNDSRIVGALQASTAAATYAPLASPALTGTPTVPTATAGTNTTQAASTGFVASALAPYLTSATASSTYAPLASPALTGTPTAPTPAVGTNTTQIATSAMVTAAVAAVPASAVLPLGQVRLTYSSASALLVKPYQGNQITVNGAYQTVPSAGVTCSNTGLTAGTLYYAYVYVSGATLTCEMVTTTHATNAANGVEIKSGDATRTLVGMAYMAAGTPGTFADSATFRGVASWFNRQGKTLEASVTGATSTATAATANATLTVTFVAWADETVHQNASGLSTNNTVGSYSQAQFMIDGVALGANSQSTNQVSTAGYYMSAGMSRAGLVSEAAHSSTVGLFVNSGTGTFSLNHTVSVRQ